GGTHLGAAHPVMLGGDKMEAVMKQKAENDAAAWARTIAETRRRNVVFAESAVRESTSLTDKVALDSGAIDLRADSIDSFLAMIAGETTSVAGPGRKQIALQIKSVELRTVAPKLKEKALAFLTDPNVVYVLILLAMAGIYFEFSSPGVGVPGVVGVVSLVLAAYGLSILPVNTVGLILLLGGIGLMMLDLKVGSHGILTAGGVVAMTIGGLMLFEDRAFKVSLAVILVFTGLTAAFILFAVGAAVRVFSTKIRVGGETLAGLRGEVRRALDPTGQIILSGELWSARSDDGAALPAGTGVEVIRKDGMKLIVRKI
ncbi:nodulation protein NfeD, partial [bacterium]|nr:nodulation protein NfeD [bacterium]